MVDKKNGIEVVEVDGEQKLVRLCSTAMPHIIFSFKLKSDGTVVFAGRQGPAHASKPLYNHLKSHAAKILYARFGRSPGASGAPAPHRDSV